LVFSLSADTAMISFVKAGELLIAKENLGPAG
jgi:hypothetical protein